MQSSRHARVAVPTEALSSSDHNRRVHQSMYLTGHRGSELSDSNVPVHLGCDYAPVSLWTWKCMGVARAEPLSTATAGHWYRITLTDLLGFSSSKMDTNAGF